MPARSKGSMGTSASALRWLAPRRLGGGPGVRTHPRCRLCRRRGGNRGPTASLRRQVSDGIHRRAPDGLALADASERCGPRETVHTLFRRWQIDGPWAKVLKKLKVEADSAGHVRMRGLGGLGHLAWPVNMPPGQTDEGAPGAGRTDSDGLVAEPDDYALGGSHGGQTTEVRLRSTSPSTPRPPSPRLRSGRSDRSSKPGLEREVVRRCLKGALAPESASPCWSHTTKGVPTGDGRAPGRNPRPIKTRMHDGLMPRLAAGACPPPGPKQRGQANAFKGARRIGHTVGPWRCSRTAVPCRRHHTNCREAFVSAPMRDKSSTHGCQ